jgi:hypothetical protein
MCEKSIIQQIREMGVGETLTYPYNRLHYIRNTVTFLNGSEEAKKFVSRSSIRSKTISVTRQA